MPQKLIQTQTQTQTQTLTPQQLLQVQMNRCFRPVNAVDHKASRQEPLLQERIRNKTLQQTTHPDLGAEIRKLNWRPRDRQHRPLGVQRRRKRQPIKFSKFRGNNKAINRRIKKKAAPKSRLKQEELVSSNVYAEPRRTRVLAKVGQAEAPAALETERQGVRAAVALSTEKHRAARESLWKERFLPEKALHAHECVLLPAGVCVKVLQNRGFLVIRLEHLRSDR